MLESKESKYLFFSLCISGIILYTFFKPGYIFLLDFVSGPISITPTPINYSSDYILFLLHFISESVIGAMVTQKILLISIFFGMLYLPLRYFPELGGESKVSELGKYVVAIFYTVNPFVYERFLAGQWGVLAGYALLWPFTYYLIKFVETCGTCPSPWERGWGEGYGLKNFQKLLIATFLVGAVSFHFLIMCLVILFFTFIYLFILDQKYFLLNYKKILLLVGVFVLASSYWLLPTVWNIYQNEYVVQGFGNVDVQAFRTNVYGFSPLPEVEGWGGGVVKVLSIFNLYGFWAEAHPWAKQFDILPNQNSIVFLPVLMVIFLGIIRVWTATLSFGEGLGVRRTRNWRVGGVVLGGVVLSAIFSLGVAETIFQPINQFLFDNIFFWKGFRDSQKWTGMLIVFMAIGLGAGLSYILEKINTFKKIKSESTKLNLGIMFLILMTLSIVLYTPKVLTGFSDKLRPVDYPESWYMANEAILRDFEMLGGQAECNAVFLPWHMYYYLGFNKSLLTANPAQKFFDCKIYTSLDPEIGEVGVGVVKDKKALVVHKIMMDIKSGLLDNVGAVAKLREEGVKYIIFTSDTMQDLKYLNPKGVGGVEQIYDSTYIAVFKI